MLTADDGLTLDGSDLTCDPTHLHTSAGASTEIRTLAPVLGRPKAG